MLYQFTDGRWLPVIGVSEAGTDGYNICLGPNARLITLKGEEGRFYPGQFDLYSEDDKNASLQPGYFVLSGARDVNHISADTDRMSIELIDEDTNNSSTISTNAFYIKNIIGRNLSIRSTDIKFNDEELTQIFIHSDTDGNYLYIGSDEKFKLSRPNNTEGGVISGIKSLTAFANPSATKVWATDGSTVDLSTKANTSDLDAKANASDVLLKKSASGGYYIEENSNKLGEKAFAANYSCNPTGVRSHAEGGNTDAIGAYSHAEGGGTQAAGTYSHAQGSYNIRNINAIHSIGIGNPQIRKNSEFVYFKDDANPKNGYKYLIGVGGYDGISTDNTTYKSVQEVIADLTARIEQLETKVKALEDANTPA